MKKLLLLLLPLLLFASTQKVTLQLEWRHQFEFAGFYVAKEQGYYREFGLDVEFIEFQDGIDISQDIIDEKVTFGVSSSSLILNKLKNKPVVLIASYFKQNALALVTSPEIKNILDLKNKKIMMMPYEVDHTSLGVMLKEGKLKRDDYELVKHEFNVQKFIDGEVDAMSVFLTNQIYILDKKNIKYNIFNPSDYGIYSYDGELFTSKDFALKNPQLVKKFTLATNRGWAYAFKNKSEVVDLIYNKYTKRKSKEALLYEATTIEKLFKTDIFAIGSIVPELIELNARIYEKLGLVDENINLKELLNDYVFDNFQQADYKYSEINFTPEELAFLEQKKIIKIANEMDWAPFDYNEFGKAKGLSINYIKLLFDKINLKYEFVNGYTWNELLSLFKEKKIDLLPALYKTKEREKYTNFITPYYRGKLAIYTLDSNKVIKSKKNLVYKKVAIQTGDASLNIVQKYLKNSKIIELATNDELIQQLRLKKIDAIVWSPLLFEHYNKTKHILNFKLLENIELTQEEQKQISVHIGVRKELPLLHSILQKTIASLSEDEITTLKEQWLLNKADKSLHLTKKEQNYLNTKKIRMCIDPDWMPFEKIQNSQHIGISADYFKIIEKKLNTKIQLVPTSSWSESIEFAKWRKCDIFSLAMRTPQREEYMNFTTPYLDIPLVLATNIDVAFVADFKTIRGKRIGIPKGYAFAEILKKRYPNLNIVDVENINDGLQKVKSGELFGYIGTLASVGYIFQTKYTGELKIAGKFDESWKLGIAVRNDDEILFSILQKALNSIEEEENKKILNKWIAIKYEKRIDYTLVWQILFIAFLILAGSLYWNRKLSIVNKQLQLAKNKAEEATKTKANFLANMSHEIRTPMNSIVGMLYLIKETKLTKVQYEYVQKIENSSQNLLKLINDILDFSKMEAKRLEVKNVDFNLLEILNNVENMLKLKTYEKGLEFSIIYDKAHSTLLYGDSLRLSQILTNLVSNAIKFTDTGKIELIAKKVDNTTYMFTISDTGIGLSDEYMKDIFSSFSQADSSTTRKYGGTGLGLAISKELVELMGGRIWVESLLGKGSTFSFEVQLRTSKAKTQHTISMDYKGDVKSQENKIPLSQSRAKELFKELKEATKKRRPQLCEPILQELQKYSLDAKNQTLFESVNSLITRYKFDEARRLLDEKL